MLDDIAEGKRILLVPPGGWAAALLIPCVCVAAIAVAWNVIAIVFHAGSRPHSFADSSATIQVFCFLATGALLAVITVLLQCRIVFGSDADRAHSALVRWVSLLQFFALALGLVAAFAPVDGKLSAALVGILAIRAVLSLLRSRSYAVFVGFHQLKRQRRRPRD